VNRPAVIAADRVQHRRVRRYLVLAVTVALLAACTDKPSHSATTSNAPPTDASATTVETSDANVTTPIGTRPATVPPSSTRPDGGPVIAHPDSGPFIANEPPPTLNVRSGKHAIVVKAWGWTTPRAYYDGTTPPHPTILGTIDGPVTVMTDGENWHLSSKIEGSGCNIGRTLTEDASNAGTYTLNWTGPTGNYAITIYGKRPDASSFSATFGAEVVQSGECT
jgi:hypothetical protein